MSGSILCAVDVTDAVHNSDVIINAHKLAELYGLALHFVTVVPDFGSSVVGGYFKKDHHVKLVAGAKAALSDVTRAAIGEQASANARHIVATGTVYEEIITIERKTQPKLIVIGAHKPDFKDYLLGPNAARVVRHSTCSVYVVR